MVLLYVYWEFYHVHMSEHVSLVHSIPAPTGAAAATAAVAAIAATTAATAAAATTACLSSSIVALLYICSSCRFPVAHFSVQSSIDSSGCMSEGRRDSTGEGFCCVCLEEEDEDDVLLDYISMIELVHAWKLETSAESFHC